MHSGNVSMHRHLCKDEKRIENELIGQGGPGKRMSLALPHDSGLLGYSV